MDASIKESVKASDKEAQYDEKAKKLLGHKIILAYILVNTVEEFQGMNPKDVVKYIEGEPYISTVPLDPGMTNTKERKEESIKETEIPEQVIGLNTENSEINEGMICSDITFYAISSFWFSVLWRQMESGFCVGKIKGSPRSKYLSAELH